MHVVCFISIIILDYLASFSICSLASFLLMHVTKKNAILNCKSGFFPQLLLMSIFPICIRMVFTIYMYMYMYIFAIHSHHKHTRTSNRYYVYAVKLFTNDKPKVHKSRWHFFESLISHERQANFGYIDIEWTWICI